MGFLRNTTFAIAILLAATLDAQVTIVPKWTVGEKRTVKIVSSQNKVKNGVADEPFTTEVQALMEVSGESDDEYQLRISYGNRLFASALAILRDDTTTFPDLIFLYGVNKKTGQLRLANAGELSAAIQSSYKSKISETDHVDSSRTLSRSRLFEYTARGFATEEAVLQYAENELGYILFPYGKTLSPTDTLSLISSEPGAFPMSSSQKTITTAWIKNEDNLNGNCLIEINVATDMKNATEWLNDAAERFAEKMPSKQKKQMEELKNASFGKTNHQLFSFNMNTGWPERVSRTIVINASAGEKHSSSDQIITVATFK